MRIMILYELPQRELENVLLLKRYFQRLGNDCEIVKYPFRDSKKLKKQYYNKLDVIIVHSLPSEKALNKLVYSIFGKVPYIINSQVEQIGTNKSENDASSYRWPKDSVKNAFHICWGQRMYNSMVRFGVDEAKLLLTGPIQMDFLRPEFNGYYYTKKELLNQYKINPSQKVCLFISSFSYVGLPEHARKDLKRITGEENFNAFEQFSIDSQEKIIRWFEKLLSENPEFLLVYRKHPAEHISKPLQKLAEKYSESFKLISDYSVKQWIIIADSILTWYSTSVGEAYFANKNVLVLRPVKINPEIEVTILNGTNYVSEYDQFISGIKEGAFSNLDKKNMMSYFDVNNAVPSFIRIGEKVIGITSGAENVFPWEKVDTKAFEELNREAREKKYLLHIYNAYIGLAHKIKEITGLNYGTKLQKRIETYRESLNKNREQEEEIRSIMEKEKLVNEIVDKFLDKVSMHA